MYNLIIQKKKTFAGHSDSVYTIAPSDKPSIFYSGSGDGMVVEWNLEEGTDGILVAKVPNSVYALEYLPETNRLIFGQNYDGIHIIDTLKRKETGSLKLTKAAIYDIKHSGSFLFIGNSDGELMVVDLVRMELIKRIKKSDMSIRALAVGKQHLAVGYSDKYIRIYDIISFELIKEFKAHDNSVFSLEFNEDNSYLLSGSRDAHLKIWDVNKEYELKESIVAHMYPIHSISYAPDYSFFATASMDKTIKIWESTKFRLLKVIDYARYGGHKSSVNKIFWSSYKNRLISCSDDRSISVWDIKFNTQP